MPLNDEAPKVNGWNEWSNFVLEALKENKDDHKELSDKLDKNRAGIAGIDKELAVLKVKAGMWGAVAGAIPGLVIAILTIAFT